MARSLRRSVRTEQFAPGAVLVRQGETTSQLYFVLSGTVQVVLGSGAEARVVARLGRGSWIGETALLTGAVSSTTVLAESDVRVYAISQQDFLAAAEADPSIFRELARELAERLRSADDLIKQKQEQRIVGLRHEPTHVAHVNSVLAGCARWAAVTPLGIALHGGLPAARSVRDYVQDQTQLPALATQLGAMRTVTVAAGEATPAELSWFLQRVADFAGLVIVTGEEVPEALAGQLAEVVSLTGAGASASRPQSVGDVSHHQVVIDERFDPERLARRICAQQIGLTFGGGGARGFAHIGVLRTLADAGIPIDYVTGTSIGAAVAAGIAAGRTVDAISAAIEVTGRRALVPSLPPLNSLFSGVFIERELKRQFGERDFEDLLLRLGVSAVDLLSGEEVLFTSGPVVPALMASMAIPGIFAPVRDHGRLLVDGALRSPVPARACREMGADIVIASYMRVAPAASSKRTRALPWIPESIVWALDVMQDHITTESVESADIKIETVLKREQAGLFDFGNRMIIEAAGEAAARDAVANIEAYLPGLRRAA